MTDPVAFFFTCRTYGTLLHGDERSSIDRFHNAPGSETLEPNVARARYASRQLADRPMIFDLRLREIAEAAIRAECAFRGWELVALAVRTNHIHFVVRFAAMKPEKMIGQIKAHVTRELRRQNVVGAERKVWAAGVGSRRYLWSEREVDQAVEYTLEGQDRPH